MWFNQNKKIFRCGLTKLINIRSHYDVFAFVFEHGFTSKVFKQSYSSIGKPARRIVILEKFELLGLILYS
jgi:hypothetical protein